jgi:hypothetical protein
VYVEHKRSCKKELEELTVADMKFTVRTQILASEQVVLVADRPDFISGSRSLSNLDNLYLIIRKKI